MLPAEELAENPSARGSCESRSGSMRHTRTLALIPDPHRGRATTLLRSLMVLALFVSDLIAASISTAIVVGNARLRGARTVRVLRHTAASQRLAQLPVRRTIPRNHARALPIAVASSGIGAVLTIRWSSMRTNTQAVPSPVRMHRRHPRCHRVAISVNELGDTGTAALQSLADERTVTAWSFVLVGHQCTPLVLLSRTAFRNASRVEEPRAIN
jgi:hypothetical protein